jgi:hypothetical protein
VKVVVGPGIVVITTGPGTVAVVGIKVVTILGGKCVVTVVMIGGRVKVETTVEPGSCVVTVPPGKVTTRGGTVKVDTTVLAGRVIVVVVMTGGSVDVLETVTTVVTGGSRDVIVCGGPWTVVTIVEAWKSISHRKGTVPLNSKLSCNGHKLCRPQELPIELPITQRLAIRILLTGKVVVERRVLIDTEICVVVTNCVVATVRVFSVVCVMSPLQYSSLFNSLSRPWQGLRSSQPSNCLCDRYAIRQSQSAQNCRIVGRGRDTCRSRHFSLLVALLPNLVLPTYERL